MLSRRSRGPVLAVFSVGVLLSLKTPGVTQAQPAGTRIIGCAIDDDFSHLPGTHVTLTGERTHRRVVTGPDGCYEFTNVLPGRYAVSADAVVFISQPHEVVVRPAAPILIFDFEMALKPGVVREPPLVILPASGDPPLTEVGISGCVTDVAGQPIPAALVRAISGSKQHVAVTGEDGCYAVLLPSNRYRIHAEASGLLSDEREPASVLRGPGFRCPALVLRPPR